MSASDRQHQPRAAEPTSVANPQLRFHRLPSGVVVDGDSGLMWAACDLDEALSWDAASVAASASRLGHFTDWRLPRIDELLGLVDWQRHDPAIDSHYFEARSTWYWTATDVAGSADELAWFIDFGRGVADFHPKSTRALVRVVRTTG